MTGIHHHHQSIEPDGLEGLETGSTLVDGSQCNELNGKRL